LVKAKHKKRKRKVTDAQPKLKAESSMSGIRTLPRILKTRKSADDLGLPNLVIFWAVEKRRKRKGIVMTEGVVYKS
jgi:hypothetical protein